MNKGLLVVFCTIMLLGMVLSGCTTEVKAYTDSGQVINMDVNKEFTMALGANLTTGYSWQPAYDTQAMNIIGEPTYKDKDSTAKGIVGAAGTQYFTFKTLKKGETQVTFTYKRPWEPATDKDQKQVFTIKIQ